MIALGSQWQSMPLKGARTRSRDVDDCALYRALSPLASAEVNFRFTCRRKRLIARADGYGERCRMAFLATWARLTFERTASSATTASASFHGDFQRLRRRHIHPFPRINCMKASIFFVIRARSGPRFCSRQMPQKNVMMRPARESLSPSSPRAAVRLLTSK